jgi:hypothetical protein
MIKARRNVRPDRACPRGIEFLKGRALLSGLTHAAAAAAQQAAIAQPSTTAAQPTTTVAPRVKTVTPSMLAVAPPMLEESHLLRNGNTVTGLVMTFSKPLDPATVQDLENYDVSSQTRAAGDGTVSATVYNPGQDAVTLIPAQPKRGERESSGRRFKTNFPAFWRLSMRAVARASGFHWTPVKCLHDCVSASLPASQGISGSDGPRPPGITKGRLVHFCALP